ncbi:MAG: hypothetical protein ACD_80C00210G0002 [uncultured bacterium (gcode 4)]|uniref:Uncharacterized protein n=1 Tax=uncultured bacterium (gcode 4) TaxID=1234023 RepID=K1XVS2_9BACT|nr:MAG: hypothetical protein ACD_80C00210G0002 [uncultured bacterium (gcode 4)]
MYFNLYIYLVGAIKQRCFLLLTIVSKTLYTYKTK